VAAAAYTSVRNLKNFLSTAGVQLRIDDQPPDILGDVIGEAGDELEQYCWNRYRVLLQAGGNAWTLRVATTIAAAKLCERRANSVPGTVAERYAKAIQRLERIEAGRYNIPGAAETKPSIPVLSQGRVKLGVRGPVTVIERSRSTGTPEGYQQHQDLSDLWGWEDWRF
jgi:hypothetical protein